MSGHLIDTNVFSEIFKADQAVTEIVESLDAHVDTTIYIECLQGSKSNAEKVKIKRYLSTFPLLPYNEEVSSLAVALIDKYSNSNGLTLADALIASSALSGNLTLLTFNLSDFWFIDGLTVKKPI